MLNHKDEDSLKSSNISGTESNQLGPQDSLSFPSLTKIVDYQPNHNFIFRICLLGDSNVGKTSILTSYCDGVFKAKYSNTIGVDFRVVTLKYNETIAKVHIWDTAGQERFKSIAINYFKSSHGFIFIYDITSEESFKSISTWTELAFGNNKRAVVNFLVGNKCDLVNQRKVTAQQGEDLAQKSNCVFFETSALNATNVERMFEFVTYKLIDYFNTNQSSYEEKSDTGSGTKMSEIPISREKEDNCKC